MGAGPSPSPGSFGVFSRFTPGSFSSWSSVRRIPNPSNEASMFEISGGFDGVEEGGGGVEFHDG